MWLHQGASYISRKDAFLTELIRAGPHAAYFGKKVVNENERSREREREAEELEFLVGGWRTFERRWGVLFSRSTTKQKPKPSERTD